MLDSFEIQEVKFIMINYNRIQRKIESTKFLIDRDDLVIPGEREEEISKLVISSITRNNDWKIPTLKNSTYDTEIAKVPKELKKHFESDELIRRYQEDVIYRHIIHQCTLPQQYFTSFCGPQIPWELNIPYELDELSHVFIGHEIMHILAQGRNYDEWKYLLLYSDVIPMLYELMQSSDKDEKTKQKIINLRLALMLEMYNNAFNTGVIERLQDDKEALRYYQMPEKQYFISFYYTVLLYSLYCEDSKTLIQGTSDVLHQKITTQKMLEQFGIFNNLDCSSFEKGYSLILKNHMH